MNFIIEEIRKRNQKVFKNLFNKNYKELVLYANGYLFDTAASEDVVQEVLIYIWEHPDKLKIKTSLKSYLFSMVRNRCLNYLKSVKITDTYKFLEFNISLITDHVFDSSLDEDKKIVYHQILKMVDMFPERMQQIVKLKFLHNYKYTEIAEELGISVNTVKTQLKRGKLKIIEMVTSLLILLQMQQ